MGSTLNYRKVAGIGTYVRAEIQGEGGQTFTNPFGFRSFLSFDSQSWSLHPNEGTSQVSISSLPGDTNLSVILLGASSFDAEAQAFDFKRLREGPDYSVSGQTVIIHHDPRLNYQFYRLGTSTN